MPMTGDAFGGNTGLMLLLNPETKERKWVSQAEYDSDQRWIADEDAFLTERAGFGLTWRNPTSQEEADNWDYATRTHAEELSRRQREMKRRAAFKPATLFETPDGDMPVLNENVPAFLKTEREKGYEPKQVKGYRSKGFIDANGQKHDNPRFFAGTDDDPALKKILMFQHENKLNGYLTPNMMHFMGYDTQESFEKEEAANTRRNERMVENEKRKNFRGMNMPMTASEVFGNAVGFGGQSLSKTNKGASTLGKINNFQAAHLNPVASTIDEWGEAVEMRLGSDEGLAELKRREAEGEDLLTLPEKFRLGLWGDAMEGVGAEGVHAYMRERQANRRGAEFTEAARGTTFGADVLRATTDSARMGIEHALYNSLLPGFKEGATVGQKWAGGLMGTGIAMGLHGDAKRQKLMADQFQYDPTTGSIKVSQKGAGAIEAALKGYGSAALEYVGEMFSNELLWKPAAKLGKWGYSKLPPSKFKRFTDSIAEKYAGSKFVKFLDQVSANPTMEAVRRLNKTTGLNLSIEGLISETIGEELPANVISAGLGLEAPGAGGWEEAFDAGVETFKNVPAMAVSVLLMGAGQGVAVRSSQGLYNYATDRATMEKALEALGHKREDLKSKKKMELNDLFFAEMAKRGSNLWSEEEIDKMSEPELDEYLKTYNVLPDGDNGQNIPIDQKRSTFKNFLRENGANVFANAAIAKINRATVRSILNGWNYGNVTDRLNTDLFVKHRDIDPDSRDKMRKIMTLRSMANTGTYRGNLAGHMLDAFANGLEGELSAKDQATLKQFENQYAKSSVAFPGTEESKGTTYEASTFKHPVAQSDWNNNPDGGYVDFGTGIAIRPHRDENGNAAGYRVDVNGAKMTVGQAGSDVDRQLSLLGINPQIGLPYGVQTTTFKTLPEARQFADNLSAWQNTEKKRLLEKAQVAQLIYDRTRPDAPGGLVLLRRPEDAPDAIRDEMVDGLRASPNRSGASLFTRFGAAQGFTSVRDGKVYLFLDNISSPYTMLNTVQHEGLHQGLIDTFRGDSKKRIAFLNELMKDPELPTFIKDELAKANNNVRIFEDILAAIAESVNNGPGLFNAVSKAMRNASARIDGIPMEEGDIHSLIFDAYKAQRIDAEQIPLNNKPTSGSYDQMKLEHGAETELQIVEPTTTEEVETLPKGTPEDAVKAVEDFAKAHPDGDAPTVENTQSSQKSTVQPTAPTVEAPKAEVKSEPKHGDDRRGHMANANDFFDNDEPAVLELGGNYIAENTFRWEFLTDLNGMDDITTHESQKKIYDKVDTVEALGAKIANEFRANGFQETPQSEQWRDEFQTFAEIVNDLPDSEQKRWALKKLANSWRAMESEIEKLSALRDNRSPDMKKVGTQTTRPNPPQPTAPLPDPKAEKKAEPKSEPKAETPKETPKTTPAPKQETPKQETPKVNKDGTKVRDPIDKAASIIASNFYQGYSGMPSVKLGDGKYALDLSHKYGTAGSVIEVYCYNKKTEELARKVISDSAKDGKNPFYSDKKGVHDYGTTFHIWSRKSSVKALLETFGFDETQKQRFGVPVEAKTTTPKPTPIQEQEAPKTEPKKELPQIIVSNGLAPENVKPAPKAESKVEPKPAPKAEAPKVELTEAGARKDVAGLVDEIAGLLDVGLFREGVPNNEERDLKVGIAVGKLINIHLNDGGRTFKGFAKFYRASTDRIKGLWEASKRFLPPRWTLAVIENPTLGLDELTPSQAMAILAEVENDTINNNKETNNERPVNSSRNDSPNSGLGNQSRGSGKVQSNRGGGTGRSSGNNSSGMGKPGVRSNEPHENVVPDQSSSDNETDGSRSGGRDNPADRSGGQSQGQETSVSNMGSSASNGDVPVNSSEGSTSSANKRGRGSQTVFDKEAQKSRDSLLKGVAVDYVIPKNGGKIGKLGGAKSRYAANIEALKILNTIQEEGRYATPEEQEKLALYSGWGGLSSVFNEGNKDWDAQRNELRNLLSKEDFELARRSVQYAHFTPISVVQTMYKALEKMGVKGEGVSFFEAGTGVGNFIGSRPEGMRGAPYMGIEVDPVSSRIVKALYPNANVVQAGFQNIILPENSVDVVVGNPPYSDLRLYDKHFPESKGMSIHNHFIAKQIHALRPGGVGTFIVSRYFMDGKDARTREYILSQADLVSAIRLPNGIFGEIAGTDVVTDILVFRKRLPGEPKPLRTDPNGVWVDTRLYTNPKREENEVAQSVTMNRYFINNPQNVLGKFSAVPDSRYKSNTLEVANSKIEDTESVDKFAAKEIWNALERTVPDNIFAPDKRLSPQYNNQMDRAEELQSGEGTTDGASHPALMTGGHFIGDDGSLYWSTKDSMGIVRHIKVQPYDDKAEKAAYLREEERRKAANPRYKAKPFDRFLHVRNASAKLTPKEQEFVKAFVHLRNVRYDLIALERSSESTDEQLDAKRKELNEAYEACKPRLIALEKPQGEFSLNTKRVRMLLGEDPTMACVTGLEEYDLRKKENPDGTVSKSARFQFVNVRKAAIFSHRVYHPEAEMKSRYSNATDAYLASINKFGRLDMAWMSEVLGVGEIELENILSENGLAFFDPNTSTWASREAYLSGDVKTKLAQAERALEAGDKRMEKNVERLKEVQPADIPVENISISFGSPIIKPGDVGAFARERLGFDRDSDVKVGYDEKSGKWHVTNVDNITDKTFETFPCPGLSFKRMLDAALNNKTVKIKKEVTVQTRLGPVVKEVVDEASSAVCNATVSSVRNLWDSWWRQSPVRGRKYVERYNERFNRYVQPKFDGSILSLEGLDKSYTPYKHQRDAAMRMIQTGNALFNHVVGSGKTLTTIISIMEMRRMGLVRKPCIVVPNSLTQQWRKDFLRAYPGANVLAPQDSEFKANERKRLMARIQSGDWDVVIMPQSQFGMLDLQPSVKRQFVEDEIANLRQASMNLRDKKGVIGVEKRIQALETAIEKAEDAIKRDETGIFFDTLGIDGLFVDEAQDFKNVPYVSSKQVTGMGNATGSGKAIDLLMKVQWMRKYMPGAPIGFLTGTPVSNSLCELYLNMRYMAPELLERMGLHTMDAFLEQFVNISSEFEITSSGSYKERMSVRNMKNVGTFMQGILSYMDVIDLDDLRQSMLAVGKEFDVPELEGGAPINVVAKRSPEQQRYFGVPITRVQDSKTGRCSTEYPRSSILGRSEALQAGKVADKSEDNLLWVYTDSVRASLDMRLVNQDNPDFKGSKVNLCVDNVIENYRKYSDWKGTQIIFCDKGVPNSGKTALKKDLKENEKELEKEETTLRRLKSEGKTEEEIAVTVDGNGESVIERIDKIKNEIAQIKSELSSTFSVYEDVKKKFIAAGIPADEIAFIHDYETTAQKLKLFERMNEGKVRILIGSTGKMGTGVNVQERIVALHHLDVPTRPADLVQRNGRAIRQGNTLKKAIPGFTMRVYQYATERTGDSFSWQMQERKARSMSAIYKATPAMGIVDDVSEAVMSAEEMKAAATGSKIYPRAAEVRKEVKELEDARIAQIHKRSGLEDTVSSASARIDEYEKLLDKLERAQKQIKPLERPEGNMYYGVEVVSPTGAIRAFEPRKTLTARKEAEGDAYESIAFQLKTSRGTLNYRGLVWKFKVDVNKVHAFESIEKSKDFDNSLFSVDIFDNDTLPGASDGILLGNINKRVNAVGVSIETAKKTVAEEQEVLESSKNELATMPETFEPTEEQKQLQVEAQDLDYVMQNNCLTGSEANYALKIKYRNEGKTMPNYEWADSYDYGESDAPTQLDPPIDSTNAGLFREDPSLLDEERALRRAAMPKGQLAKAQEAVHNALVRDEGETPKAWAKRKVKAVGSFVSSLMVDSRRPVVDAMKEITGREKFHESEDIPLAMQLSYGRVFAGHHEIDTNYVKPVLKKLADNGLNLEDLDIYLTAMFAPERNKMIKERTETATKPGNLEGSGMSDEKAAALLNAMREEMTPVQLNALESAAELVYKMNRENLDRLVEYGIMAEEQAEEWKRLSPHYVPLRDDLSDLGVEFPDQVSMVGQNYVHAVGRFSEAVTSQFAWSILQAKQGIMWAEQNYINNVALNFCHNNKSDEDYVISPMPVMSKKVYKGKRGFRPDDAIALRTSVPSEAAALKTLAEAGFTLIPDKKNEGVYWVDTREMEMIPRVRNTVDKLRTAQRHNVIAKVGGKKVYILFNPQKNTRGNRMGRAITRADMWDPKHPLWTVVTQLTRIKALMTTTLSPTFAINNMRRDLVQTTGIMLAEGRGEALKDVYRNYLPALKAVRDWKKTDKFDDTEVGRYFKEAVENGVLTGTWANSTHTDTMMNSVLDPLFDMQNRQKFGKEIGATIGVSYRGLKDFLNTFSEIPEVGMRLAVYSALRKNGMSKNEATVYAREITIDFNKKGQLTPVMNVLYMFSNASIQSVARWNKAIRNPDGTINKRAYLGALSYMLIGFFNKMLIATAASALFGGGDDDEKDDERWKNIPDYAYQRGVPIMLGDYYVDMPVQGVPSAFLYLGSRLYDVLVDPNTSVAEAFVDTAKGPLLENVNFVNGTGSVWQFLTPTFLDPVVQIIENKSWTGAPLHAMRYPNDTTPASYSGRKTTSEWAKAVAKGLNAISGGDDIKPGAMDFYPETIALIGQFFVSQVGVDAAGIGQLLTGDLKVKNVPILRGLLKEVPDETNRYYAAATDFAEKLSYWKDYNAEGRDSDIAKLERNNSFLLEANRLQNIQNRIRKLVTEKNRLAARGIEAPDVDKSISYYRKLFLDVYSGKTEK